MEINWQIATANYKGYLVLERSLSKNSVAAYMRDIAKLSTYMASENIAPTKVCRSHIEGFMAHLSDSGINGTSMARTLSGVRSFFDFLMLTDKIENSPTELIKSPKIGRTLPHTLSYNEIMAIMTSVDLSSSEGHRNRAILEVLYSCGIRVSELTSLRISDLFLSGNVIRVIGKGNKQRLTPISDEAVKFLEFYLEQRRGLTHHTDCEDILFLSRNGRKLNREMIFYIVRSAAAKAGIKKSVHPHTLRHSFASHLVQGGADILAVQQMLGHESVTTTEIYTHLELSALRSAVEQLAPDHQA